MQYNTLANGHGPIIRYNVEELVENYKQWSLAVEKGTVQVRGKGEQHLGRVLAAQAQSCSGVCIVPGSCVPPQQLPRGAFSSRHVAPVCVCPQSCALLCVATL